MIFTVNLRLDFCAKGRFFWPLKRKTDEPKPKFTTKVTSEVIASANSIDEIAAGADC
jgi:hypothetical protein